MTDHPDQSLFQSAELRKWQDNAPVILTGSSETAVIQAIATNNNRVIFSVPVADIISFRTFQTLFNELGVEIKLRSETHKFIAHYDRRKSWFAVFPELFALSGTFRAKPLERMAGIDKFRELCETHGVNVRRTALPRTITLIIVSSIVIGMAIAVTLYKH